MSQTSDNGQYQTGSNGTLSLWDAVFDNATRAQYEYLGDDVLFHWILYKVTVPALFGLIILIGLIGNFMVIFVIIWRKKMRTTINLLLLNLAFSDVTFLVVCVPFVAYHYAADNWLIGDVICKLSQFLLYVTVYVTVYSLVSIAIVRFLTIVYAASSTRLRTKRNTCILIGLIWSVMLLVNIPILLVYRVKQYPVNDNYTDPYYYCGMESRVIGQHFFLSFFILTYVIPLGLICTFYIWLLKYLRQKRKGSSLRQSQRSRSANAPKERASFASRILVVVVVVFGVCWLPLHVHLLLVYSGGQPNGRIYQVWRVFCHCLAYANSIMNPFIYNYVSKDFRRGFLLLANRVLCRPAGGVEEVASHDNADVGHTGENAELTKNKSWNRNSCYSNL